MDNVEYYLGISYIVGCMWTYVYTDIVYYLIKKKKIKVTPSAEKTIIDMTWTTQILMSLFWLPLYILQKTLWRNL